MSEINLDEMRAAEEEEKLEERHLVFGGERIPLPPKLPLGTLEHLGRYYALNRQRRMGGNGSKELPTAELDELMLAGRELLGDEWHRFKALGADFSDVLSLLTAAQRLYFGRGTSLGESPASGLSSEPTGESSRPTSLASTGSTPESSSEEV